LPRAALGKAFADGKGSFAECGRHSAKATDPVVLPFLLDQKRKPERVEAVLFKRKKRGVRP